tara:strand:+ start:1968 stop:2375 length:408 start_codon:yes stop_codon:yes gene_type:complete
MIKGLTAIAGVATLTKDAYSKVKNKINQGEQVNEKLNNIQESLDTIKSAWVSRADFENVCSELEESRELCINLLEGLKTMETHDFWQTMDTIDGHKSFNLGKAIGNTEQFLKESDPENKVKERRGRISEWMSTPI